MIIGVPQEIKAQENRVGLLPSAVYQLTRRGHIVLVGKGAGAGTGHSDEDYARAGAELVTEHDEIFERFTAALAPLRDANKLGPVLLQYPRWFVPSRESAHELRAARLRLGDASAAVEFRNPAWVTGRVASRTMQLLEELQFTYVVVDAPPGTSSSMPNVSAITTPGLAVVRLHGRRTATWEARNPVVSERYRYLYDRDELLEWSRKIEQLSTRLGEISSFPDMARAKQGVHVVFNNCHANYGTTNADEITALLIEFDKERLMRNDG